MNQYLAALVRYLAVLVRAAIAAGQVFLTVDDAVARAQGRFPLLSGSELRTIVIRYFKTLEKAEFGEFRAGRRGHPSRLVLP
jgi:hypothetical protein